MKVLEDDFRVTEFQSYRVTGIKKNEDKIKTRMKNHIKPFGWRRNLDYFNAKLYLSMKIMKEYKANFYSMIFFDIILLISSMIGYFVIGGIIYSF